MFTIESVKVTGLKGGDWAHDFTCDRVLVSGPNGSGKSRIRNAIEFIFGAAVEGAASSKGTGIVGLVAGDTLRAVAHLTDGTKSHTVARARHFQGSTFKNATIEIDGEPATDDDLLLFLGGELPTFGAGDALLSASAAERSKQFALLGARALNDDPDAVVARLDAAKRGLNDARSNLRACEARIESARKSASGTPLRPEVVEGMKSQVDTHRAAHAQWERDRAQVEARFAAAQSNRDRWSRDRRAASDRVDRLKASLKSLGDVDAAALGARLIALESSLQAAESLRGMAADEHRALTEVVASHRADVATAREKLDAAKRAREAVCGGSCPTCYGPISASVLDAFDHMVSAAESVLAGTKDALDGAAKRSDDAAKDVGRADAQIASIRNEVSAVKVSINSARDAERITTELADARVALAKVEGDAPEDDTAMRIEVSEVLAREPRCAVSLSDIEQAARQQEAHVQMHAAMKARADAEVVVADAKRAVDDCTASMAAMLAEGGSIVSAACSGLLPDYAVSVEDGEVFLSNGTAKWSGAGLSGAQRATLALGIDVALARASRCRLKLAFVEADDMDAGTLEDVLTGMSSRAIGVMVFTCHPPARTPTGWQSIRLGVGEPKATPAQVEDATTLAQVDLVPDLAIEPEPEPEPDAASDAAPVPDLETEPKPVADTTVTQAPANEAEPPAATEPATDSTEVTDASMVTHKQVVSMLAAANPSTAALREILGSSRRGSHAAMKRNAGEVLSKRGLTVAEAEAIIKAACDANPKRAYTKFGIVVEPPEDDGDDDTDGDAGATGEPLADSPDATAALPEEFFSGDLF